MRGPFQRAALAQRQFPLAIGAAVDIGQQPQQPRGIGAVVPGALDGRVRCHGEPTIRQCQHVLVRPLERERSEIDEIARQVQRGDLARAVFKVAKAAQHAVQHQHGLLDSLAAPQGHAIFANLLHAFENFRDRRFYFQRDRRSVTQPPE